MAVTQPPKPTLMSRIRKITFLDILTWLQILIIQWIPWLAVFALQDRAFRTGISLAFALACGNLLLSYWLFKRDFIKAFPKWLDLCFIAVFFPLNFVVWIGGEDVQFYAWAWMPLILNAAVTLTFLISLIFATPSESVMDQYYRDVEGPPIVWQDPNFVLHGYVLNWLWFVSMLLMTAATAVTGATDHKDRTLSVAGVIANYLVQFGIFALACILNIIYSLYMRKKYMKAAKIVGEWGSGDLSSAEPSGEIEFQALGSNPGSIVKEGREMGSVPVSSSGAGHGSAYGTAVPASGGGDVEAQQTRDRHRQFASRDSAKLMKNIQPSA